MQSSSETRPFIAEPRPEASILVVGYKSLPYIGRCLDGAIKSCGDEHVEFLFLDCSDDGSEQFVRDRFPSVRVLPFQGNLGFARGNNVLAKAALGQRLLLLNPDAFAERTEIFDLIQLAKSQPKAAAWAGMTMLPDGSIDGGSIQPMLGALPLFLALVGLARVRPGATNPRRLEPQRAPVLTGAFMMVRRDVWERLQGFDEQFFMYAEEVDLCKRITDDGGYLLCDPSIQLIHDTGSGERRTPTRLLNLATGNATFYRKHFGPLWANVCNSLQYLHACSRTIWGLLAGRRAYVESFGAVIRNPRQWWSGWPPNQKHAGAP